MPVTKMSRSCRICLAQNGKLVPGATNTAAFGHRLSLSTKGASEKCRHLTGGGRHCCTAATCDLQTEVVFGRELRVARSAEIGLKLPFKRPRYRLGRRQLSAM